MVRMFFSRLNFLELERNTTRAGGKKNGGGDYSAGYVGRKVGALENLPG